MKLRLSRGSQFPYFPKTVGGTYFNAVGDRGYYSAVEGGGIFVGHLKF